MEAEIKWGSNRYIAIGVYKSFIFDDVEVDGEIYQVSLTIDSALIRDHGPDDEAEIMDYMLDDLEYFDEMASGFIPVKEDKVEAFTKAIKDMDMEIEYIHEAILSEYYYR